MSDQVTSGSRPRKTDDEKDAFMLEVARDLGPPFEEMARRFIENGQRRRSPDPVERYLQGIIDRLTLQLERGIIHGRSIDPPGEDRLLEQRPG